MISCVVFDFDGTVVRSNAIKKQAFCDVVERLDCPPDIVDAVLTSNSPGDRFQILKKVVEEMDARGILPAENSVDEWARRLTDEYSALCEKDIAMCPEVEGAEQTLRWLRDQGYRLFLNSATPLVHLQRLVRLRSLDRYFSGVYGGPASKTANLRTIFVDANVACEDVLSVGDGEDDRRAAVAAGCHFAGFADPSESAPSPFSQPPEYTLGSLSEVKRVIAGLEQGSIARALGEAGGIGDQRRHCGSLTVSERRLESDNF